MQKIRGGDTRKHKRCFLLHRLWMGYLRWGHNNKIAEKANKWKTRKEKHMTTTELSEYPLPDSYIVYPDYVYVCDGKVVRSDIQGTVADLKRDFFPGIS